MKAPLRKRKGHALFVRLDEEEYQQYQWLVEQTRLPGTAVIRRLLMNSTVRDVLKVPRQD